MKSVKILIAVMMVLAGVCTGLCAQELSVGKYSGTYIVKGGKGETRVGIDLNIASIENGVVKGTTLRHGKQCRDTYSLEGTYKENNLVLRSDKGGGSGDCSANFRLVVEGNKLTGTMGTLPVELSK